jgi:hypothetical protein
MAVHCGTQRLHSKPDGRIRASGDALSDLRPLTGGRRHALEALDEPIERA